MFGFLLPLAVPNRPWEHISVNFMVGLPERNGFDKIWVVVDRLSKMRHCIPRCTTIDTSGLAEVFLQEVVHDH